MIVIRSIMVWTEEKDVKLLRAVAAEGVLSIVGQDPGRKENYGRLLPLPLWQNVCLSFHGR